MSTYTRLLYQIIFSTKYRQKTMIKSGRGRLYGYIVGILKNKRCHPYRINGVSDHLHIVTHIHQAISIASLVKDIKVSTSKMIKQEKVFPDFIAWQEGYSVFSYSSEAKKNLIRYVANQEMHHQEVSTLEELIGFYDAYGIEYELEDLIL